MNGASGNGKIDGMNSGSEKKSVLGGKVFGTGRRVFVPGGRIFGTSEKKFVQGGKAFGTDGKVVNKEYRELLDTVKPKAARFLHEKYNHWWEVHFPRARNELARKYEAGKERLLHLRLFSSVFQDYATLEKTGYSFGCTNPGIELPGGMEHAFDLFLRGIDDSCMFIHLLSNQKTTPKRIIGDLGKRFKFLNEHKKELDDGYSIAKNVRYALLLTEREKKLVRTALQTLGKSKDTMDIGEVHVIELVAEDGILHSFPSLTADSQDTLEFTPDILLQAQGLDLRSPDYLIFELCLVQECYARHLMDRERNPKEISRSEIEEALFRLTGLSGRRKGNKTRSGTSIPISKRKEFARNRLESILSMALRYNLVVETGEKGTGKGKRKHHIYRLICQGSDLTTVQKNLFRKYLDPAAGERAAFQAGKKAAEAYRKRYPRIDGKF